MKKIDLLSFVIALLFLASCDAKKSDTDSTEDGENVSTETTPAETVTMAVSTDESQIVWEGTMVGVYSHDGIVKLENGSMQVAGDKIVGGEFVVDLTSMTPTDENYNPEEGKTKEKLIGHLSSDDFFNVEEYPSAKFVITSYDDANNTVTGDLTIRGNTNEETVENVSFDAETGKATGTLTFDRTKYDVSFQSPAQDMVLSDDIELEIALSLQPMDAA
jgi:polyisoprenoid-binding protein YceI